MKNKLPLIAFLLFTSVIFSQSFKPVKITKTDGTTLNALGKFEFNQKSLISGLFIKSDKNVDATSFDIKELDYLMLEDIKYVIKSFNRQNFIFEEIIKGELSMYKSKDDYYLIKDELEVREIPFKSYNTVGKTLNFGIISVYINNCLTVQEYAYNRFDAITAAILEKIVTDYNNCSTTENITIPAQAISDSKIESDRIGFGVSIGYALLNTNFENFVPNADGNISTPTVGAKLYVYTSALNDGLFFNLSFDYFFGKEQQLTNRISNRTQYVSALIGVNYQYKSGNETFTPFVGVHGGFILNGGSNIINKIPDYTVNYDANSLITYNFTVGSFINVFNQKIEAAFIYQPKMKFEMDNSSIATDIKQSYDVSGMQFKLTYCF